MLCHIRIIYYNFVLNADIGDSINDGAQQPD